MSQNNKIEEWGVGEYAWAESVDGITVDGWQLETEVELHAHRLARSVCSEQISVKDLWRGVRFANALDREAVEVYGADLSDGEQQKERIARRLMHHAGRQALLLIKDETRRVIYRISHKI